MHPCFLASFLFLEQAAQQAGAKLLSAQQIMAAMEERMRQSDEVARRLEEVLGAVRMRTAAAMLNAQVRYRRGICEVYER